MKAKDLKSNRMTRYTFGEDRQSPGVLQSHRKLVSSVKGIKESAQIPTDGESFQSKKESACVHVVHMVCSTMSNWAVMSDP